MILIFFIDSRSEVYFNIRFIYIKNYMNKVMFEKKNHKYNKNHVKK